MPNSSAGPADSPLTVAVLAKLCSDANCPTLYRTNRGTVVVQGYPVSAEEAGIDLPPSEFLVEIPAELLSAPERAET